MPIPGIAFLSKQEWVPVNQICDAALCIYMYIQGVSSSSLCSLSPCTCVEVFESMDDIIIMHCTCTVLYQGP